MLTFIRALFNRRMLCVFLLGFSSGLPLLLIGSTFKTWMTELNVSLTTVGLFASVGLPYSLKFLWAPLLDRYQPPLLDRRRGWILVCQIALAVCLAVLAYSNPSTNILLSAVICLLIAFFSATQDISIDAYRREVLRDEELGLGSSMGVGGYRVGMLLAGAGSLAMAQLLSWQAAYLVMAGCMLVAIGATLFSPRAPEHPYKPKTLKAAVVEPLKQFFQRPAALEILVFILLFKIGDQMASDMLNPFYVKMGYQKIEIAEISKIFGFWAVFAGSFLGGALLLRVNLYKCLWGFGILQALSTLGFSWLAVLPAPSLPWLTAVVAFENISSGMGMAAYVAFIGLLTDRRFTAAQYALLSSLMSVPRVIFGSSSGALADMLGWSNYYLFCAAIAIPGMLMLLRSKHWTSEPSPG
jgi:MFS transporter, PAT family, beta-lactamase induction signal transducer AmpG